MPTSRKADYCLGMNEGAVFLDFNRSTNNRIVLCRISFDGFGCCELKKTAIYLGEEESNQFLKEIEKELLDQKAINILVRKLIEINQTEIWTDALLEYGLID